MKESTKKKIIDVTMDFMYLALVLYAAGLAFLAIMATGLKDAPPWFVILLFAFMLIPPPLLLFIQITILKYVNKHYGGWGKFYHG